MNTKTKTLLVVLGTLIIGAAIGAIGSGMLRYNRWERYDRMDPGKRFLKIVERVVQPDEQQKAAIQQIAEKYASQMAEIRERHQDEITSVLDSMRNELDALLTEEQRIHLKEYCEKSTKRSINRRVNGLTESLNLTDEQRKQVENIFQEREVFFSKNRRVFDGSREEKTSSFREEMDRMHREIENILTPEQIEKYRELKERKPFLVEPGIRSGEGRGKHNKE